MSEKIIFDRKNTLVIGGAGFIGSHLCDELIKKNKVICMDNFVSGNEGNIDHLLVDHNFAFIKHDITEYIYLDDLRDLQKFKIQFQGIQEIYYLASPTSPKDFKKNKINTLLANSIGLRNALDMAKEYNAKFMFFSSAVVYGEKKNNNRIKEDDLGLVDFLSERGGYDEGKRFAETMVKNYKEVYNLDAKIIRLFRTFGPRMKLNDYQMIPDFVSSALDNTDINIFGDENFSSTFCYVSDVIDAAISMMNTKFVGPLNIGVDIPIKIKDFAQKIIDFINSKSKITYRDEHYFFSQLPIPDITKASNEIGWIPIVTIDKGIEKTIEDIRARKNLHGWI